MITKISSCLAKHVIEINMIILLILLTLPSSKLHASSLEGEGYNIAKLSHEQERNFKDETVMTSLILIDENGNEIERKTVNITIERPNAEDYSLIQFLTPADVRGAGLLTYQNPKGNDIQWIYLPELRRTKRISSSNKSGSFMGSEFSYEDITGNTLGKWKYQKIADDIIDGNEYFVLEKTPIYNESGYSKVKTWISKLNYLVYRSEMFDRKKSLLKVQIFSGWKKYNTSWKVDKITMENLQTNKKSILTFYERKLDIGLSEKDFTKNSLNNLVTPSSN